MKILLPALFSVFSIPAIAAGTLTLQSLPSAPEEANPVCRDANGTLANCIAVPGSTSYYANHATDGADFTFNNFVPSGCVVGPHTAGTNEVALIHSEFSYQNASMERGMMIASFSIDGGTNWTYCSTASNFALGSNPASGVGNIVSFCAMPLTPGETYQFGIALSDYDGPGFTSEIGTCSNVVEVVNNFAPPPPITAPEAESKPDAGEDPTRLRRK